MSILKLSKLPATYHGRYGFWRMIYLLALGALVGGSLFTYYFIHQSLYNTFSNTAVIATLRSAPNLYDLDIKAFQKAKEAVWKKHAIVEIPPGLRNIFLPASAATSTYATSTSGQ